MSTSLTSCLNFLPARGRLQLPERKDDSTVYILSDSYEYDIEFIKRLPQPKMDYKNIIIPLNVHSRVGVYTFDYSLSQSEFGKQLKYIGEQRMSPMLNVLRPPYPKFYKDNLYISMSELVKATTPFLRKLSIEYIKNNIFSMFSDVLKSLKYTNHRAMYIDTTRFKIYSSMDDENTFKTDIINALICGYFNMDDPRRIPKLPITLVFHGNKNDYKFDMNLFETRDLDRFQEMLDAIGRPLNPHRNIEPVVDKKEKVSETVEKKSDVIVTKYGDNETKATSITPSVSSNTISDINAQVDAIKAKYASKGTTSNTDDDNKQLERENEQKLRKAKQLNVQATLLKNISVNTGIVGNYKRIADDMIQTGNTPVENKYLDDASKTISSVAIAKNNENAMDTATAAREQKMRERIGKLKLGDISFSTLTSVIDVPKPTPIIPRNISTTNPGSMKGTSFSHISKAYEENLMDRDIVQTFMNLSNQADGFEITNVEVTDISTVHSLKHDWKISLRSKATSRLNTIHVQIPKVIDGKFYNNGIWFNIGKQDFPVPVLKLGPKRVMLTSNYQKITVERYDTRSLVDIGILVKVLSKFLDEAGNNKYIKPGTSTMTNARFLSTVEYDEYAKVWFLFTNREKKLEICFDRNQCLKLYGFVNCEENEFCCGMNNKVPIIINTDTGVDKSDRTITDIIIESLPPDLQSEYQKIKPGKRSMYAEMNAAVKTPVGVTCCAWIGLTKVLKKANVDYKIVGKRERIPIGYIFIDFMDYRLLIKNTVPNQLLFNGFNMIDTKSYRMAQFEIPIMNPDSVYVDIYNTHFFKQYSQLTMFIQYYNFWMDAITYDVCNHYNLPTDVVGLLIYATNMLADNNFVIENTASLYRVRSTEVVPAILHYELARAISQYNNSSGSKSRDHMLKFNQNCVLLALQELATTETASALNPMVELHQRETITQKGYHGVNVERAYTRSKRSYHESMIGKEAIATPNSANVGMIRQLTVDPKIESVRGYTSTQGPDAEYNDLQLASFSELLTPGTVSRDDAIRTAIATAQTSHIVSTAVSQPTLISNGIDEIVPGSVSDEFAVMAEDDGKVIDINGGYMIVEYTNLKKKRAIEISDRYHSNPASGFYVNNKLVSNFQVNDSFKKNDILAYHEKFFTKGVDGVVRLNIGPVAKVAFTSSYFTYEDSGMMTESFSKKLATSITMCETIRLDATANVEKIVKVGDEVEIGDPLVVLGLGDTGDKSVDNFLKAFRVDTNTSIMDAAKRTFKAKHAGKIVDVKMFTIKSMDKLSPSLYDIFTEHFKENEKRRRILDKYDKSSSVYKLDTLYDRPTGPLKGQQIKGITTDVLIEVYIEHEDFQSVGDKLVAYAASKQVIGDMVPVGKEPYSEYRPDEEVSVFVSARSILNRMIPSCMITAAGNKVLIELKRQIKQIWES